MKFRGLSYIFLTGTINRNTASYDKLTVAVGPIEYSGDTYYSRVMDEGLELSETMRYGTAVIFPALHAT